MTMLKKLKKIGRRETGIRDFCIRTIRFKKFLENARALLDFFADGREKVLGEYIFDRHYVVTLIDSVVDRLGMMVYDASILAPGRGEEVYAAYDQHKLAARNLIGLGVSEAGSSRTRCGDGSSDPSGSRDPEYQLLSEALEWFQGMEYKGHITVMEFMKQTFFHVIQGMESYDDMKNYNALFAKYGVRVSDMEIYMINLWKDALAPPSENRSIRDFKSIPLRHLLMHAGNGELGKPSSKTSQNKADWVAAASEYQLSLNTLKPDFRFRLETLASGYEPSDFIFVFADPTVLLDKILPDGFHVERTDYGQFAWSLDISAKTIEDTLIIIGRNLFDESTWRMQ